MTYQNALKILGWSGNLPKETAIAIAKDKLANRVPGTPLRYSVAAKTVINHLENM